MPPPRPTIVRRIRKADDAHLRISRAIAENDPAAAISATLDTIEALVALLDGLLVDSVRVTRRRT